MSQFTEILNGPGTPAAMDQILPLVYEELRLMASRQLRKEQNEHTLQPTALVHEVYLRFNQHLSPNGKANESSCCPAFHSRAEFFAAAGESMRRILIDKARKKLAIKRGGHLQRTEFEDQLFVDRFEQTPEHLIALDEALEDLEQTLPRHAQLIKLRFFVGFTLAEAAEALGISCTTAKRHWIYAQSWLFEKMQEKGFGPNC